jgi:hypothetical protein
MIRYQSEGAYDGGEAEVARASVEELFPHRDPEELEEEETKALCWMRPATHTLNNNNMSG